MFFFMCVCVYVCVCMCVFVSDVRSSQTQQPSVSHASEAPEDPSVHPKKKRRKRSPLALWERRKAPYRQLASLLPLSLPLPLPQPHPPPEERNAPVASRDAHRP